MKSKITKFEKIFAVSALVLTLAGCGQAQSSAPTETQVEAATTDSTPTESSTLSEAPESENSNTASSDAIVTTEKPEINASDIWKKYDKDPDKNTPTYDGDQETATGVITYIGKDDHGTDSMQISDTKGGTSYVLGVFGSADEMSAVSVGDTVTITGNFHIMSSSNMVVLKSCKILNIYK